MENLKIVINGNEDIAKKAKEYFEILGYYISNENRNNYYGWSLGENSGDYYVSVFYFNKDKAKLVTVEQLRDLVVLKRNSIEDATHIRGDGKKYFHAKSTDYFYQFSNDGEWLLSTWMNYQLLPQLKPIKNPMKEYLDKNRNYELVLCAEKDKEEGFIEVPEGAECAMLNSDYSLNFFKNINGDLHYYNDATDGNWFISFFGIDSSVVWQRHTQPEELPFIDDKPILNDQYAEVEKVRQDMVNHPNHYTQGKVECIDALESATIGKSGIEAVCVANVIKYLWRYEQKNGLEDVKKAQFYLNRLVATLENNNG